MVHGVTPASPRQEAKVRSPERRNAALGFHLAESAVVGGNDDIACKHHLDANREDDTLYGGDDRLATPIGESESLDSPRPQVPLLRPWAEKPRHIQTRREVAGSRPNHTH